MIGLGENIYLIRYLPEPLCVTVKWSTKNKLQSWDSSKEKILLNKRSRFLKKDNAYKNIVCKMAIILFNWDYGVGWVTGFALNVCFT